MLCKADEMWFCGKCRIVMKQHAVTDIEIERRCKQIVENYEEKITSLEKTVGNKCEETELMKLLERKSKAVMRIW